LKIKLKTINISILVFTFLVLALLPFASTSQSFTESEQYKLTFEFSELGLTHKCLDIDIQNKNTTSGIDVNLTSIFNETDFDLDKLDNVWMYEWKALEKDFPTYDTKILIKYYSYPVYNETNKTEIIFEYPENCWNDTANLTHYPCNSTNTFQNGTITKKQCTWKPTKMNAIKHPDKVTADYSDILIPMFNSKAKYDDFGAVETENGTKNFRLCFDTPIETRSDGWGNAGTIYLDINGETFVDKTNSSWWNQSFTKKIPINCTNMDDFTPIVINGSDGFKIDDKKQIVWTYCSGDGTALYYNDETDYVVANDTHQLPFEVEFGNGTSYNPTSVWTNYYMVQHLNDATTSTVNDSVSNIVGNKLGANEPIETDGKIGKAQDFDGSNDKITYTQTSDASWSLSHWFKMDTEDYHMMSWSSVTTQYQYWMFVDATHIDFYMGNSNSLAVSPGTTWHQVVMTMDSCSAKIYLDGAEIDTQTYTSDCNLGAEDYTIGDWSVGATYEWDGIIDEFRVSDNIRSASYINQTYQNAIGTSGYGNLLAEESAPSANTAPSIISNITKPDTVYTNTDWKLNITATDPENASFTAYTQFYINGESSGGEASHSINNNTNTNVANLSSSSFNAGDKLIAEMWVSDIEYNSTKTNSSEVTVSYFVMGGTVKYSG